MKWLHKFLSWLFRPRRKHEPSELERATDALFQAVQIGHVAFADLAANWPSQEYNTGATFAVVMPTLPDDIDELARG